MRPWFVAISKIVKDESLHLEQSEAHLDVGQFWPRVLMPIVAASTESVYLVGYASMR